MATDMFFIVCTCCNKPYKGQDMEAKPDSLRPEFGMFAGYALFGTDEEKKLMEYREAERVHKEIFGNRQQFVIRKMY